MAEWLTRGEAERTRERSDSGPEGVRDGVPNNALPCMVRRAIERSANNQVSIRRDGRVA